MKKTNNNSNLIEENELYKQKAQYLSSNKNYREVINCYEKIAKNGKIEIKAEKDEKSKFLLKSKVKRIKKLIKNLKVINALDEMFSADVHYLSKDFQDSYYWLEQLNLDEDEDVEYENISRTREGEISSAREETPKKNCYKCNDELTFKNLRIANPSVDEEHLKKLFESPYIEFYCCSCCSYLETKTPYSVVRELIKQLNLMEKNVSYPLNRIWHFKMSGYREDELIFYLNEVAKVKNNNPNDFTRDINLISLVKKLIPDFIIEASTITIKKTVFYHKFKDYETAIIFIARRSFDEMIVRGERVPLPKRFKTSNFSKARGFFYKKERWSNKYYLTDFGWSKFFQISFQIEKEIDLSIGLSTSFKYFFNL